MKFQFVMMTINNLQIPMIRIDKECYITQKSLEKLLGVSKGDIYKTFKSRRDEFDGNRVNNIHPNERGKVNCVDSIHAKEFIRNHKELLGVKYIRDDMHLWSEHDMLTFTMLIRGPRGKELRAEIIQFIKDNAKYETVPKSEHDATLDRMADMERRLEQLQEEIEMIKPILKEWAKLSGKSLQVQSKTKSLRKELN